MKQCSKCKKLKKLLSFPKRKDSKDGYRSECDNCTKKFQIEYRKNNDKKIIETKKEYYKIHRQAIIRQVNKYQKRFQNKIRTYHKMYKKTKRQTDINFRLKDNLRNRLNQAIRNNYKSGSAVRDLGCSIDFLKQHLQSKFNSKMTWNNYGIYWEIDHIKPLFKFDLTDRKQLLTACNYKNLQPLTSKYNRSKGAN